MINPWLVAGVAGALGRLGRRRPEVEEQDTTPMSADGGYRQGYDSSLLEYRNQMRETTDRLRGNDPTFEYEAVQAREKARRGADGFTSRSARMAAGSVGGLDAGTLNRLAELGQEYRAAADADVAGRVSLARNERNQNNLSALKVMGSELGRNEEGLRFMSRADQERRQFEESQEARRRAEAQARRQNELQALVSFANLAGGF